MKSLLHLLMMEDQAAKELEARRYGLDKLRRNKIDNNEILDFQKGIIRDSRSRFIVARREVRDYLLSVQKKPDPPDGIGIFMQMLMKEARRDSLVDRCAEWNIDETEMAEYVDYLEDLFGVPL